MLIENQIIDIKWTRQNFDHYKKKGYTFSGFGKQLLVRAEDLTYYSKEKVLVSCDYCGDIHSTTFVAYNKGRKAIQKDSCEHCVGNKCAEITLAKRQNYYYEKLLEQGNKNGHKVFVNKDEIKNNKSYIKYECPAHGIHNMRIANYLHGKSCPECSADEKRKKNQFQKETVIEYVSRFNGVLLNSEEYINSTTKNLKIACPECKNEFVTSLRSFVQHGGQLCPHCSSSSESLGELRIRHFLENNNIDFRQEHWFSDCRDTNPLPFDFYIPSKNTIIEFDGRQHFQETNYFSYSMEKTLYHDSIKTNYCRDNGIELIRIPYWKIDSIGKILSDKLL